MGTKYTNAVLTVIAAALCALVLQNATLQAVAKDEACGKRLNPCFVTASELSGLRVRVVNGE